ncbi:acyl-CoA desaturase [Granulicella arctica]|uniref:Stearoyl-CoA desaturase (Delta-9 desaturase) n=1 Tax=Granulicella arctica TaxID=940613 RepID=A0A7Y9PF96_9BACT|nr:acyl-CoA desaturase [Granulicella arctica]NYF78614.1 stearoyl-CoA desaturase (delta-9 desaturase) [Granulicella arctica]
MVEKTHEVTGRTPYQLGAVVPFFVIHMACLAVFFIPFRWSYVAWAVALYIIRMFGVTAGYHRYFSHRSFKLGRTAQFCLAFLAETSAQKGVLWWAAHHRVHHQVSDEVEDIHSPEQDGFWWAHIGWVLSNEHDEYDSRLIKDFSKFPELRWISKYFLLPPTALSLALLAIGGWPLFLWGFCVSTVVLFHGTFLINSVAHVWGTRRFDTPDHSRNNFLLALITLGEGWHNNHHKYMYACRQGLRWWEIDVTYYLLRGLKAVGIVHEIRGVRLPQETQQSQ